MGVRTRGPDIKAGAARAEESQRVGAYYDAREREREARSRSGAGVRGRRAQSEGGGALLTICRAARDDPRSWNAYAKRRGCREVNNWGRKTQAWQLALGMLAYDAALRDRPLPR